MPHDMFGTPLKSGDIVYVPCIVLQVNSSDDYCNVNLETTQELFPSNGYSHFSLNSKQVMKTVQRVEREVQQNKNEVDRIAERALSEL